MPDQHSNRSPDERAFPDIILKSQFLDGVGRRGLTSEQRLMLAVLADAINAVHDGKTLPGTRGRSSFTEARDWIFRSGVRCPLAFEDVCDALDLDPDALRWRIGLMLSGDPGARTPLRLQLKQANRVRQVTVNRDRQRYRRRGVPGSTAADSPRRGAPL